MRNRWNHFEIDSEGSPHGAVGSSSLKNYSIQSSKTSLSSSSWFIVEEQEQQLASLSETAFLMLASIAFSMSLAAIIEAVMDPDAAGSWASSSAKGGYSSSLKVRSCTKEFGRSTPEIFRANAQSIDWRR